jgi:hypothetical protein
VGEGAQSLAILGSVAGALRERLEVLRGNARLPEVFERPGKRRRHRPPWDVRGNAEAGAHVLVEETRGEARVVPGVPRGEALAEELRLRDGAREVQHAGAVVIASGLRKAVEGDCPARGGEPPRQLHRRGHRRSEEDDRVHGAAPGRTR